MDLEDEEEAIRRAQDQDKDEPLLRENPRRFVMFPVEHHDIWQFYKKAEGMEPILLPSYRDSLPP